MKIRELAVAQVRIPLRRAIKHASHSRTETDNVVVRCTLDNGIVGHGEGVPREYVTGETIASALELLRTSSLMSQFEPCRDFPQAVALAERLRLASVPNDTRQCRGNAARCALELAVLDAYGQHFREPVSSVTRYLAPELYSPRDEVRYSGAIMSASGFKLKLAAMVMWGYRFKQVKVKVGIAAQDDVARLQTVRKWLKNRDLRIDANEAWTPDEAVERIRALEPIGITSVEQPVPEEKAGELARVRKAVRVPIMLDESLCSMVDAERAAGEQLCDLFNLRLSKCGGFIPSLRLAQFAKRRNLGYQLGCQVGETAILSAAGRHFASSVGDIRYVEGSFDRHLVREALGTRDLTFGWGGKAAALTGGGLGITLDPAALQRVLVGEWSVVA